MIKNRIIVVFCHTRPKKLKNLIDDLSRNTFFGKIKILFIQDGLDYKLASKELKDEHLKVKKIIDTFEKKHPNFVEKKFKLKNCGLASTIENNLDELAKIYDSIIVLEDDLCISKNLIFLMSNLLDYFEEDKRIFHINAWAPPNLSYFMGSKIVLTKMMYCWGWATWSNRWIEYRKSETIKKKEYLNFFKLLKFDYFGLAGHYYQLNMNWKLKKKTWAIFWQLYMWSKNYYCLSISKSITRNNGLDKGENHQFILKNSYFSKVIGGEINEDINIKFIEPRKNFLFELRIILQLFLRNIGIALNKIKTVFK